MPRLVFVLLFTALATFGQQQSFILELDTAPAALDQFRGGTHRTARAGFAAAQASVRDSQRPAIRAVENVGGTVVHRLDTILNALFVDVPDAKTAARLASIPGVKRVQPVLMAKAAMDRALGIHKIPEVWNMLPGGPDSAGAGMRLGIIDTGIDIRHPGLLDDSLTLPEGFPKFNAINEELDRPALSALSNNKILFFRSYENLTDRTITRSSARDFNGHGTGVAFAAGGRRIEGPAGPISGVAPKAQLGVYKISAGEGGSASTTAIFAALEDAVKDGMDVINMSFGIQPVLDDYNEDVTRRVFDAGVLFVASVGNEGPGLQSSAWPGQSPWVIGVGSSANDRLITRSIITPSAGPPALGINGTASRARGKFSGTFKDAASIANNELGCDPFPADALKESVALILRGTCTFEVKLNNASKGGAVAVVIYNPVQVDVGLTMLQGDNTTPAAWVNNDVGLAFKNAIKNNDGITVVANFAPIVSPNFLSDFSSRGPTAGGLGIKPDLVGVGESFITASPVTCCDDQSTISRGLTVTQGTSLSSPVIAGAAIVLKQARPGLKLEDYRSLLVNTSRALPLEDEDNRTAIPHEAGGGRLDLSRARLATVTASPVSISFGGGTKNAAGFKKTLKLRNIGDQPDTFTLSVEPLGDSQKPELSSASASIDAKAAVDLELTMSGTDLRAGHHHGFVIVKGSKSEIELRVPYWYGVASAEAGSIAVIRDPASPVAGLVRVTTLFRVTDSSGQALDTAKPEIEAVTAGGTVEAVDADVRGNGLFGATLRPGRTVGTYTFRIKAGSISQLFFVTVQ